MEQGSYLIADLQGHVLAFNCQQVEFIIEIDKILPVPQSGASIVGIATLRSRIFTVVDLGNALVGSTYTKKPKQTAAVVSEDKHQYALLLDRVIDIRSNLERLNKVPVEVDAYWQRFVEDSVVSEDMLIPVVNLSKIVGFLGEQTLMRFDTAHTPIIHHSGAHSAIAR